MPVCCVQVCKNRSINKNYKTNGITYHRFPKEPKVKEKWINILGRSDDWFPSKSSTICSVHFEEKNFQPMKKSRRLFPWAIPAVNLRLVFEPHCLEPTISSADVEINAVSSLNQDQNTDMLPTSIASAQSDTPRKQKLKLIIQKHGNLIKAKNLEIKRLQTIIRRYKKKVSAMKDFLDELKEKCLINADQHSLLESTNVAVKDLVDRCRMKSTSRRQTKIKYTAALRSFAMTLHFYSPKAYEHVRQKFETCLPHTRTIKKWYQSVNANPGFTTESLNALKSKVDSKDHTSSFVCNLVMDEMAIRQRIEWDGNQMHGYVDIGNDSLKGDYLSEAKQALVFLVTAINAPWKVPVGYFLVDGVTGEQRANLVRHCLDFLHKTGIEIVSLTFDGCPANITMAKQLGCVFEIQNMKTYFEHPITKKPVQTFLDPCHMLKLVRNAFQANGIYSDQTGRPIKWCYLEKLNEKQEKEHLHLANKLRRGHIFFHNQKMKVKLASQLFSNSVADALSFCAELKYRDFQGVEATVDFLKIINDLFDILNSRNMKQLHLKKPLNTRNKELIFEILHKSEQYIKSLKLLDGSNAIDSSRKTGFIGFIVSINSLKNLYITLVEQDRKLQYLPAYKISQDHLELMFGHIRAHGGCNTNPTARQFQSIYKKMLVKSELRDFETGNCTSLEEVALLNCSSAVSKINCTIEKQVLSENVDDETENLYEQALFDEEIDVLVSDITEFSLQTITYIAGFVVHTLLKKLKCDVCVGGLLADENDPHHRFIKLKDKGGLIFPSNDTINVCKRMEIIIKEALLKEREFRTDTKMIKEKLVPRALSHFIGIEVFKSIEFHQYDQSPMNNHLVQLTKAVMEKYMDTRLHHLIKHSKPVLSKRQVLNKYLHFTGQ